MPISIKRYSPTRRNLLAGFGLSYLMGSPKLSSNAFARETKQDVFALVSDTHIPANTATQYGQCNMSYNLQRVVSDIIAHPESPSRAIFNGDLCYLHGLKDDYLLFAQLTLPLVASGCTLDLALGNHDDRSNFYDAMLGRRPNVTRPPKVFGLVVTPNVNWLIIDTLEYINLTPGILGEKQLLEIDTVLAANDNKPTFVIGHHSPDWGGGIPHTNGLA